MTVMSVRELNANLSRAIARAEAGEVIEITRNGRAVVELRKPGSIRSDDPEFGAARERLLAAMERGVPALVGPASYEERPGR